MELRVRSGQVMSRPSSTEFLRALCGCSPRSLRSKIFRRTKSSNL